ncbi:MAG: deoxynucleoside kinase [Candidatus Latescibacterota bacterium]
MDPNPLKCPHRYIAVEGVIGVGKTSLCRLLAEYFNGISVFEDFETNPFIKDFYRSPREYAFKAQLFFLISRFKQYMELPPPNLFGSPLVVDYIFQKDRIFASVTLDDDELDLYQTVCNVLEPKIVPPDLVVYLQASTDHLLKRITMRGRGYEQNISREYIEALNNAYNDFFFHYTAAPVFIVNTDNINFVTHSGDLRDLITKIVEPRHGITYYHPGGK